MARTPTARCRGATAITTVAVVQLALASTPRWAEAASPFTSGTTRGTSGSWR